MVKKKISLDTDFHKILLYTTPNGNVKLEVYLSNETIWLTQQKIAELFGVQRPAITKHLRNIFETRELLEKSVSSKMELTAADGKKYLTQLYNLDAIISVGYRVNSIQATHFRMWATQRLKDYIIKGFAMDDERLKNPVNIFGKNYFDELLARIRDIRSSERLFYQKITDIYAQCSVDYNVDAPETKDFFATVQNKLHWAITGQTAAEIIFNRVDSKKENMGLTTWKNAPRGVIRKADVIVAKNYLTQSELESLNRIVSMYLDYAENQARKGVVMTMKDWVSKLDAFLIFNEEVVLNNLGKVSHNVAIELAEQEYEKHMIQYDKILETDFDNLLKRLKLKE